MSLMLLERVVIVVVAVGASLMLGAGVWWVLQQAVAWICQGV